jgi:hypothetical protein
LARDLGDVLTAREGDLSDIASKGRAVLEEVAQRAPKLPSIVRSLDGFLGVWVADLSEGPNWRIYVTDPPIVLGEPYPAGEEPTPRKVAAQRLMGLDPDEPVPAIVDLLLDVLPLDGLLGSQSQDTSGGPLQRLLEGRQR